MSLLSFLFQTEKLAVTKTWSKSSMFKMTSDLHYCHNFFQTWTTKAYSTYPLQYFSYEYFMQNQPLLIIPRYIICFYQTDFFSSLAQCQKQAHARSVLIHCTFLTDTWRKNIMFKRISYKKELTNFTSKILDLRYPPPSYWNAVLYSYSNICRFLKHQWALKCVSKSSRVPGVNRHLLGQVDQIRVVLGNLIKLKAMTEKSSLDAETKFCVLATWTTIKGIKFSRDWQLSPLVPNVAVLQVFLSQHYEEGCAI